MSAPPNSPNDAGTKPPAPSAPSKKKMSHITGDIEVGKTFAASLPEKVRTALKKLPRDKMEIALRLLAMMGHPDSNIVANAAEQLAKLGVPVTGICGAVDVVVLKDNYIVREDLVGKRPAQNDQAAYSARGKKANLGFESVDAKDRADDVRPPMRPGLRK